MKLAKPIFTAVALSAVAAVSSPALAIDIKDPPRAIITADGQEMNLELRATQKGWELVPQIINDELERWSIEIKGGELNPDPSIGYAIGVADFGAPSTFGFFFFTPIVPTGPCSEVYAGISGGLTDSGGPGGDGMTITPFAAKLMVNELHAGAVNAGVDVGDADGVTAGDGSDVLDPDTKGFIAAPAGIWTGLSSTLMFTLSGGGDSAAITGEFIIKEGKCAVPDGGAGLVGLATLGSLLLLNSRKRKA